MLPALLSLALALVPAPSRGPLGEGFGSLSRVLLEARVGAGRALVLRDADGTERGVASCEVVRGLTRIVHQREVVFSSGGVRLLQTEEIEGTRRRLVFRELRANGARTWVAEWDTRTGVSTTTGYGWRRPTHGTLGRTPENLPPAMGALELLDAVVDRSHGGERLAVQGPVANVPAPLVLLVDASLQGVVVGELAPGPSTHAVPRAPLAARRREGRGLVGVAAATGGARRRGHDERAEGE